MWEMAVGPFAALAHRFVVETNVPSLVDYLDLVFGSLRTADGGDVSTYRIEDLSDGGAARHVTRWESETLADSDDPARAVAMLLWHVNRRAVEATTDLVVLHAAGAARDGRAVILPAPMESGKTTLVAGLLQRGFDYLSDELVAVEPDGERLVAYPKAVSLDPGSWPVLPDLQPTVTAEVRPWIPRQWQVAPQSVRSDAAISGAAPMLVVFPRYLADTPTVLSPLHRADALLELAQCTFGFLERPERNLRALSRVAGASRCSRLQVGELQEACDLIERLFEEEAR